MIAPKGPVSNGTWKRISRGLDKIDNIYKSTAEKLDLFDEERYRQADIYDEIISWRAVLRSSGILTHFEEEGLVKNIYGESLSLDLDGFTEKLTEKMETYWDTVGSRGSRDVISFDNIKYEHLHVLPNVDLDIDLDSDTE